MLSSLCGESLQQAGHRVSLPNPADAEHIPGDHEVEVAGEPVASVGLRPQPHSQWHPPTEHPIHVVHP
jgi:hypothetical protein